MLLKLVEGRNNYFLYLLYMSFNIDDEVLSVGSGANPNTVYRVIQNLNNGKYVIERIELVETEGEPHRIKRVVVVDGSTLRPVRRAGRRTRRNKSKKNRRKTNRRKTNRRR